ncbi:TPA: hypothetical protein EYN98_07110 [Candidatus Poribacteria bacterium]|nr:hypothetical protein [Candidatus Poribacteria bacterium]
MEGLPEWLIEVIERDDKSPQLIMATVGVINHNLHTIIKQSDLDEMTEEQRELLSYLIATTGDVNLSKKAVRSFVDKGITWDSHRRPLI